MVRVITQEIEIEESLKKKIEFICNVINLRIENKNLFFFCGIIDME